MARSIGSPFVPCCIWCCPVLVTSSAPNARGQQRKRATRASVCCTAKFDGVNAGAVKWALPSVLESVAERVFRCTYHLPGHAGHSMTSSARSSRDGEMVRLRVLAVLRFTTNPNFVGCWKGSSSGLVPLRIRSM